MPSAREIAEQWEALAGLACTCAPGCTDVRWGDGPPREKYAGKACDPECEPCRRMRLMPYHPPPKSGKKQT